MNIDRYNRMEKAVIEANIAMKKLKAENSRLINLVNQLKSELEKKVSGSKESGRYWYDMRHRTVNFSNMQ